MESHRWKLALCLFLVIAPLATFWQLTDHDFINFDDDDYVTSPPFNRRPFLSKMYTKVPLRCQQVFGFMEAMY